MKIGKWIIGVVLLLLPLILGYVLSKMAGKAVLVNDDSLINLHDTIINVWKYLCFPYWLIVGVTFQTIFQDHKRKGLLLFFLPVLFLLGTFVLTFTVLDPEMRSSFIGLLSQYYSLGFVRLSVNLMSLFSNLIHMTYVVILAYIINIIVFLLGYSIK